MPSTRAIEDFLAQDHIAFVGVSRNEKEFANSVYRKLRGDGARTMYPVNAAAEGAPVEGDPSYRDLADVPDPVDGVVLMVPVDRMTAAVADAVARGIPRVWLHRGAGGKPVPDDAVQLCHDHGIEVVDGACPLMFEPPVESFHRFHHFFIKRRFAA